MGFGMDIELGIDFDHPRPRLDRVIQWGSAALAGAFVLCALLCLLIALAFGLPLMVIAALFALGLACAALLPTTAAPAVTLTERELIARSRIWGRHAAPWNAVGMPKPYTLLPPAGAETMRRALIGRNRYRPAEGVLIPVRALPFPYRIHGWFAGEGFTPAIALTNRAHRDYDRLIDALMRQTQNEFDPLLSNKEESWRSS
jgi:MFS family permease